MATAAAASKVPDCPGPGCFSRTSAAAAVAAGGVSCCCRHGVAWQAWCMHVTQRGQAGTNSEQVYIRKRGKGFYQIRPRTQCSKRCQQRFARAFVCVCVCVCVCFKVKNSAKCLEGSVLAYDSMSVCAVA